MARSEIKVVPEEDYGELIRIVGEAYPSIGKTTQADRDRELGRFKTMMRDDRWTPYGVYRGGKLIGVYRNLDFDLNVRGKVIPAGGLGMVAVDLMHKKEHVAKEIVETFLAHYDAKGVALTTLWPFRVDFYHSMGFGLGGTRHQYKVKPAALRRGPSKEQVRYLSVDDIPALNECYNRVADRRTGMIRQIEASWQNRFEFQDKTRFVGCEIGGRLEGYLMYRFALPEHPSSFMDSDMIVTEMFYHTPEALSQLLTFLHSQHDQVDRIHLSISDDEFYFLMSDPTLGSGGKMAPTYHLSHLTGVGIMYRVMDVSRLFEQLSEHDFSGETVSLTMNLTDSFFPTNQGSTTLQFDAGRAKVIAGKDATVAINIGVAEFSSMIMGAVNFSQLLTYQLAEISDQSYAAQVSRLFAYPEKPLCVTGF